MTSLRQHLTRTLLGAILVLGGTGLVAIYLAAREAVVDQFDAALRAKAQAIETLTHPGPGGAAIGFSDRFLRGFDDYRPRDFFELWDASARSLARSESLVHDHLALRAGLKPDAIFWQTELPSGRPGRALGFTFVPGTDRAEPALGQRQRGPAGLAAEPTLQLIVVSDRDELDDDLSRLAVLAAGSAAALLAATLWLIPRVLRRGLTPLDRLGDQAAAIDSHSLGTRFAVADLPEELRPIAVRLNDLLARIEQSFERERRFSADLAHELRTPLAELRSSAECALKWPESREPTADRETLAIAVQMEGMVSHMLALARSEQGQLNVHCEPIILSDLVRQRWERLITKAGARGLTTELALPSAAEPPLTVLADPALLRAILDNIFENAVEYTTAPGPIVIAVNSTGVAVTNPAPDLAAADVPRLFERFWRKESARSGGHHVGLGLSLARAFAEAMGWILEARLAEGGILVLALTDPGRREAPQL